MSLEASRDIGHIIAGTPFISSSFGKKKINIKDSYVDSCRAVSWVYGAAEVCACLL